MQVIVLGNGAPGACYTVVDAHTGQAVTGGALPLPLSQAKDPHVIASEQECSMLVDQLLTSL